MGTIIIISPPTVMRFTVLLLYIVYNVCTYILQVVPILIFHSYKFLIRAVLLSAVKSSFNNNRLSEIHDLNSNNFL